MADLPESIQVSTPFADGAQIPVRYSCDGENRSPELTWSGVPAGTASLAVVVDDPDAPGGTYVHWVLFGVPASVTSVAEGAVPEGARQARNSAGHNRYDGPCPPSGKPHHYRFKVYALGEELAAEDGADADAVLRSIEKAATAHGQVTGTFAR
jgi:Raf kinase inhibitor-like YbhB/YbcL family protein